MSILNTFYIMFKSNSQDVVKGNKEIERSTKDTKKALENTNDEAHKLGQNFLKTVEAVASFGGAVAGFNIVKTGVNETANLNTQLKIMADLGQQNVSVLKQMGQAASAAGGSMQGAMGDIQGLINMANDSGKPLGPVNDYMQAVRDRLKGRSMNEKQKSLSMIGVNDPGLRWLLSSASDEEYEKRMGRAAQVSPLSQASADNAFKKAGIDADLAGSKGAFWTRLWDAVSSPVNTFNQLRTQGTLELSGSDAGAIAGAGGIIGGSAIGAGGLAKALLGRLGLGGMAAAGSGAVAGAGVAGGGLLGGMAVGSWGTEKLFKSGFFDGVLNHYGLTNADLQDSLRPSLTGAIQSGNPVLDFWKSQGYSDAQAAGIMANMKHESGFDPNARGDGGLAHGLFQHHPDRRQSIMDATGINMSTDSFLDQMKGAAWEMKNGRPGFSDEHFRSLKTAEEAAAYFSQKFESPADGTMQAMMRGKTAMGMLASFPGGGAGTSVQIDKIEITTQATDATGLAADLKEELYSQLSNLEANYDDGIEK